jgi:DNA-binding ferritin-like protein
MEELASLFMHSRTQAHVFHLRVKGPGSHAAHKALQKYYESIVDLADTFAESYQGKYDQIKKYPNDFHGEKEPIKYFEGLKDFVEESREHLPKDTELQNIVDEIADLINSTLYKLRFLK